MNDFTNTSKPVVRARILLDSVSSAGIRLTTLEVEFPRYLLAEFNTHRQFSRNFRSSRAVPVERMLTEIEQHPFVPLYFGKNQPGCRPAPSSKARNASSPSPSGSPHAMTRYAMRAG
jgi:hypothetical protein